MVASAGAGCLSPTHGTLPRGPLRYRCAGAWRIPSLASAALFGRGAQPHLHIRAARQVHTVRDRHRLSVPASDQRATGRMQAPARVHSGNGRN